ncbi:MAG: hypothetical protein PHV74_05645 [Dehalococcoidia bacterium]|nr:hypothetical protein [Dehalococcoidia bacterium]
MTIDRAGEKRIMKLRQFLSTLNCGSTSEEAVENRVEAASPQASETDLHGLLLQIQEMAASLKKDEPKDQGPT